MRGGNEAESNRFTGRAFTKRKQPENASVLECIITWIRFLFSFLSLESKTCKITHRHTQIKPKFWGKQ